MARGRDIRDDAKGESKTPIIVAMVFFILTTLGLGVMLYMSYAEKDAAKDAAKKATDDKAAMEKLRSAEQDKVLLYRAMLGLATAENLDALKNTREKERVIEEYAFVTGAVDTRLKGLSTQANNAMPGTTFNVSADNAFTYTAADAKTFDKAPERDLFAVLVGAYAKQVLAGQRQAQAEKLANDAKDSYTKLGAQYTEMTKTLDAEAKAFPGKISAKVQAEAAKLGEEMAKFSTKTAEYQNSMRQNQNETERAVIKAEQETARAKGLQAQVTAARDREALNQDAFQFDKPHGKVTTKSGSGAGAIVYIDVGSADRAKPGLKFVIQPADTATRGIESRRVETVQPNGQKTYTIQSKGTVEIVEVVGEHTSQARVVTEPNTIREPILPGDLIYNSAWRKGAAEHVALYGVFDLDADGTDDLKSVVANLNRTGYVVDAYYDLTQRKWIGTVSNTTTYAVEGYRPANTAADGLSAAKASVEAALNDARAVALQNGVRVVKARDFFPRIGYKMDLNITPDLINRAYNRYLQAAPPAAEAAPPAAPAEPKN